MKRFGKVLLLITLAACSQGSSARAAWLLVGGGDHDVLVFATEGKVERVAELGDQTIYGKSASQVGVLSYSRATGSGKLLIVDKKTRKTNTIPVNLYPLAQLSGSTEDLIVGNDSAYFVSIRFASDRRTIDPNSLGGPFDLNRVDLASGKIQSFPFPKDANNPRLVTSGGKIIALTAAGSWAFDPKASAVEKFTGEFVAAVPIGTSPCPREADSPSLAGSDIPHESKNARLCVKLSDATVRAYLSDGTTSEVWNLAKVVPTESPSEIAIIDTM